jgi:hypothetical protein
VPIIRPIHASARSRRAGKSGRSVHRARMAGLLGLLIAAVSPMGAVAVAGVPPAARLLARDPGALVGGNTIVATDDGARVLAVPNRPNFILMLGSNGTVVARGGGNDQIGAFGSNDTIRAGSGDDTIFGGPGGTLIGGPGHDELVDTHPNATIVVRGSGDEVVLTGRGGRVRCSRGLRNEVIYRDATAVISASCRADHARILPERALHAPPSGLARLAQTKVTGDGTAFNPFMAPCEKVPRPNDLCTVDAFPPRYLGGLWDNEHVPAYACPDNFPWLHNQSYVPPGAAIPVGVEIQEDWGAPWPIAISITSALKRPGTKLVDYLSGTATGFPWSSATNWTLGTHWYKVILHCTDVGRLAAIG